MRGVAMIAVRIMIPARARKRYFTILSTMVVPQAVTG
jgi:hypothetical protein